MSEELTKREQVTALATKMDELAAAAQGAFAVKGNFERTFLLGIAMNDLREALTDSVMKSIMKLKNSQLGFRTDERPGDKFNAAISYGIEVVRDCVIQACILGLQCVGNHFNILAGRFYVTKEGFIYLLRNLKGLTDLKLTFHPAVVTESSTSGVGRDGKQYQKIEREALARVDMSWKMNGKEDSHLFECVVRVNNGMSQDAILGKAERKCRCWLYNYLTDNAISDADVTEVTAEMRDVTPRPAAEVAKPAARLTAKPAPKATPAPAPAVVDVEEVPKVQEVQNVTAEAPDEAEPNYAAEAPDEAEQERAALDWLHDSVEASGKTIPTLYKVLDVCGHPHPPIGSPLAEVRRFALKLFRSEEMRTALEESGFVFAK